MIGAASIVLVLCAFPLRVISLFGFQNSAPSSSFRQRHKSREFLRNLLDVRAGNNEAEESEDENGPLIIFDSDEDDGNQASYPQRAIVLMDAFCRYHGMYLASRAEQISGTAVIPVLSNYLFDYLMATKPENAAEYRRMRLPQTQDELAEWKGRLPDNLELVGVYCESDSGLSDAERLRKQLEVTCRDEPDELEARRNKYLMQEWVREKTSLPVPKQKLCETLEDAQEFASDLFAEGAEYVVVKPYRGVASESVQLCKSSEEVANAFQKIIGSAVFGSRDRHENVLVQEFLAGQEYAIDVVSRDGDHKIAAVWRYEKKPANGASFCYFQTRLVDATMDPVVDDVCQYVITTLKSLGIRYGLSHNEVIVTADRGPMLVEVNCRQHNMDFAPLTMACIGYNALDMLLVAMFGDEENWSNFPGIPVLRGHGCMVHLVNFAKGFLKDVKYLDKMSSLDSFLDGEVYEYFLEPGQKIEPTVDIRSDAGWVQLINENEKDLVKDYKQIVEWMPTMFEVE